jgi:hypothetical protein
MGGERKYALEDICADWSCADCKANTLELEEC